MIETRQRAGDEDGAARAAKRALLIVIAVALAVVAAKLILAATTAGTNDVRHFRRFAIAIERVGPIEVYGDPAAHQYNHGPVTGYLLVVANFLRDLGLPVAFTIRLIPTLADFGSVLLVFAIARRHWPLARARTLAIGVALSPILLFVSGFHGNTDPLMAFLMLLALYLANDRGAPVAAGAVFGLSLAVKLVPVVALPALLASARSWRSLVRMAAALAAALAVLWGPVLLLEWDGALRQAFQYVAPYNNWGVLEVARRFGWWGTLDPILRGPLVYSLIGGAALLGAVVARRHPRRGYAGAAVALIAFLVITPGWGAQYLAWPVALGFLLRSRFATVYGIAGGAFLFAIYTHWSGGLPWDVAMAGRGLGWPGAWLGLATWALLGVWLIAELARAVRHPGGAADLASSVDA